MVKHGVILRGYGSASNALASPPLIAKRTEAEFLPALLQDLRNRRPAPDLAQPGPTDLVTLDGAEHRRLFQPIHRAFNLVVLEAVCDAPGHPRIHPSDIASAGFVVRRVAHVGQPEQDNAWQLVDDQPQGWDRPADPQLDPDPKHRRPALRAGNPHITAALAKYYADRQPEQPAERTTPLFIAPPEVCTAAGRTLLYGIVPVTSSEEQSTVDIEKLVGKADVRALLPPFLSPRRGNYTPKPTPGTITGAEVDAALALTDEQLKSADNRTLPSLRRFILGLRTLHSAWRLFDDKAAKPLLELLGGIQLAYRDKIAFPFGHRQYIDRPVALVDFLRSAVEKFVVKPAPANELRIPEVWPFPDRDLAARIVDTALARLLARYAENPPRLRRFDREDALYRIHAFVRVRHTEECPPHLHWSAPSAPFAIAPWWESGPTVHTVSLPDLADFSKLKPNVAFTLPPKLANLLNQGDPKKLLEGSGGASASPSIMWICSFSLPAITLCAFIVLNIFLKLFDLMFGWMFSIKICLPFKKL